MNIVMVYHLNTKIGSNIFNGFLSCKLYNIASNLFILLPVIVLITTNVQSIAVSFSTGPLELTVLNN